MFQRLGGVFRTVGKELWTFTQHAGGEAVGKVWSQQTEKLMKEGSRRDVMETIRRLEGVSPAKAEVLIARLDRAAKTQKPDLENYVVAAMGHLLPRDKDDLVKWDEAVEVFEWLADEDDAHFAVVVEAMKHDPIIQLVRYWVGKKGLGGLQSIAGFLSESSKLGWEEVRKRVPETAKGVDDWAANTAAPAIHRFRASQKWLKRSRRRQDQLENRLREQQERGTRERVAELHDQFRRGWSDRRGS